MSVHFAGGSTPHAADDAVLVLDAQATAEGVTAVVHAEATGVRVVTAADRQAFMALLQAGRWSLVIVSFDSEEYPGPMALRDARELSSAPVIAIGTGPTPSQIAGALRGGAEDFIARPASEVLGARVARLLGRAGAPLRGMEEGEERIAHAKGGLAEHHAMLLLDRHWRVTDCSRGVTEVLGYQGADLIGRAFESLFVGVPEADDFLRRLRTGIDRDPYSDSFWMLRSDGLRMWAEITCVAGVGEDDEAQWFCVTVRDATLQYRATQSVRNQADAAAAATARRNLFLGSIAHELRGALAPISTSAAVLQRPALERERHERLAGIIRRNAASAARLVEDLLTFSTASENKLLMRHEEVDLNQLVIDCTDAAQHHAAAARVGLQVVASTQVELRVKCDAERIRQVVVNLIGNAIKFTPTGGSVQVRTSCGPDGVDIEVTDNGAGIDPSVLPFIFEPFEQGGTDITARFGGFGLGLAICAVIAKQHGGSMTASSEGRGQGATFRLSLPRHGAGAGSRTRRPHERMALHVLYVEDDADAADAMRYALTRLGWTMTHAASCASARELVCDPEQSFDVVLADLGLPDGSGLELGHELCSDLPVVALTAYGAPLGMQGFASHLIKPAEIGEVQRALLRAVAVHRKTAVQ